MFFIFPYLFWVRGWVIPVVGFMQWRKELVKFIFLLNILYVAYLYNDSRICNLSVFKNAEAPPYSERDGAATDRRVGVELWLCWELHIATGYSQAPPAVLFNLYYFTLTCWLELYFVCITTCMCCVQCVQLELAAPHAKLVVQTDWRQLGLREETEYWPDHKSHYAGLKAFKLWTSQFSVRVKELVCKQMRGISTLTEQKHKNRRCRVVFKQFLRTSDPTRFSDLVWHWCILPFL